MTHETAVDTTIDADEVFVQPGVEEFKKKSVSGAVSYTLRSLFLYSVNIVSALILGWYLSPEEFGIYGIVTQMISLLQFFSSIGLGAALIQKKSEPTIEEYRAVFTVQQMLSWLIFSVVLLIIASGALSAKIGESGIWVLLALAFSFPMDSFRIIPAIILERKLDFSKLIFPDIVGQLLYNAILIISVVFLHQGVIAYAYAVLLRGIVSLMVMYSIQRWAFGFSFNKKIIRAFLTTGAQFQLSDFLARIKDNLFYLALGAFLPLREFGFINWAKSWSQLPYNLTVQNVIAITFPAYSRLQHDKKLLTRAIEKTVYFISISVFPLLAGMAIFVIPFTTLLVKYQKWQPALFTFALFTLSIGWAAVSTPLTNTLSAIGQVNKTVRLMIMWTILTWVLTPICIWIWGFNGVATAAFLISFTSLIPIYMVKKIVPVQIVAQVKDSLLATVGMSILGIWGLQIWKISLPHMFGGIILCVVVYGLILLFVGKEKLLKEVRSLLQKKV